MKGTSARLLREKKR